MIRDEKAQVEKSTPARDTKGDTPAPDHTVKTEKKPTSYFILALAGIAVLIFLGVFLWKKISIPVIPTPTSEESSKQLSLSLASPKDGELALDDEILVSGTTGMESTVVVYTETDEVIVETDADGNFETTVTLAAGINSLNIKAFTQDGEEESTTLDIVYDDEI